MAYNALVNFPDGTQLVLSVEEPPQRGTAIEDGAGKRWTVTNHTAREDTVKGEPIQFEVSVAEPERPGNPPSMGGGPT